MPPKQSSEKQTSATFEQSSEPPDNRHVDNYCQRTTLSTCASCYTKSGFHRNIQVEPKEIEAENEKNLENYHVFSNSVSTNYAKCNGDRISTGKQGAKSNHLY